MSKYTTELRFICESLAGLDESAGYSQIETIIENSRSKIFDFDYEIFDERYREALEKKILMHYYTREIAAETYGLWKLWLMNRMREIMPYYNQLYLSTLIEFNPLWDTQLSENTTANKSGSGTESDSVTEEGTADRTISDTTTTNRTEKEDKERNDTRTITTKREDEANKKGTETLGIAEQTVSDSDSTESNAFSDTPHGKIEDVRDMAYLTDFREVKNDYQETVQKQGTDTTTYNITDTVNSDETKTDKLNGTEDNTTTENTTQTKSVSDGLETGKTQTRNGNNSYSNTESFIKSVSGANNGESYSKKLMDFRKTFLNIDMMIIDELNSLFFGLW